MNQEGEENIGMKVWKETGKQKKENRKAKDRKDKKKEANDA